MYSEALRKLTKTAEGKRLYQREWTTVEVTEVISQLMEDQGVTKKELANRLGKGKAFVTQILNGRRNMTLHTVSDVFCALNSRVRTYAEPLSGGRYVPIYEVPSIFQQSFATVDYQSLATGRYQIAACGEWFKSSTLGLKMRSYRGVRLPRERESGSTCEQTQWHLVG